MTRLEKELVRLTIEKERKMTEAIICFQYGDHTRSLEAQNEAGNICGRMAKIRSEGVRLPSKYKERKMLAHLDRLYGKCAELFKESI